MNTATRQAKTTGAIVRVRRVLMGATATGTVVALLVRAGSGLPPLDVLHTAIAGLLTRVTRRLLTPSTSDAPPTGAALPSGT